MLTTTTLKYVPALLAGCLTCVKAQGNLPTAVPAETIIWFPKGIPEGPTPSKLEANVAIVTPGTTTWSFTGIGGTQIIGPVPTTTGAPDPFWHNLGVKYASEGKVLTMDYTGGYALMHSDTDSTYTGTQYSTFMHVVCTSMSSDARCSGSYGTSSFTLSSVSPERTTVTISALGETKYEPGSIQDITALPVTVTKAPSVSTTSSSTPTANTPATTSKSGAAPTQTPAATTSSSTGGVPKATQQAGALAGAAALLGGALMLI